jgi:murein DD-endopeptidase MepM/ murein hydrolase activator NlpD
MLWLRHFFFLNRFLKVLVATVVVASVAMSPALAGLTLVPPVRGRIVDPWRLGDGPYSSGNRGVDFAAEPGELVRAVAAGTVSFSGQVAGVRWVVIRHSDDLRTTVGPLSEFFVRAGESVGPGYVVGKAAGSTVHLGLRRGDLYIDPTPYLVVNPATTGSPLSTLAAPTTRVPSTLVPSNGSSRVRLTK